MWVEKAMTDNVIDIRSRQPHMTGHAVCLNCQHAWQAVSEIGCTQMECPDCGLMKGVYRNLALPLDKPLWQCQCGCQMFYITATHAYCGLCGVAQEFG